MYGGPHIFYYLLHWLVTASALMLTSYVVPGFRVRNFGGALITALVLGLANMFIRPILLFFAFPFNVVTLGLFTFVVNGAILKLCSALLKDFDIDSWFHAILGAVIFTIIQMLLYYFLPFI